MLAAALVALTTVVVGAGLYVRWAPRRALDIPNQRSSHTRPTPRGGGIVIVAGFLLGLGVWVSSGGLLSPRAVGWLLGAVLVAGIGFVDDLHPLPALPRLLVQLVGAAALTSVGVQDRELPLMVALPVAFVYVAIVTNVYNFMDGIDGLASTQALVGGAALGIAGGMVGNPLIGVAGWLLAATALGFLVYNRPPARLFMGDAGSTFLGFTFAALTLLGNLGVGGGRLPLEFGVLVLAPFLFDGLITLTWRVLRGERWYTAHRSHFYQRLVRRGWSHALVTGLYASLAVVAATSALASLAVDQPLRPALALVAYAPMLIVVGLVWRLEGGGSDAQQPNDAPTVVTPGQP